MYSPVDGDNKLQFRSKDIMLDKWQTETANNLNYTGSGIFIISLWPWHLCLAKVRNRWASMTNSNLEGQLHAVFSQADGISPKSLWVGLPPTLVHTETFQQQLDGLHWHVVQTFMMPGGKQIWVILWHSPCANLRSAFRVNCLQTPGWIVIWCRCQEDHTNPNDPWI